MSVLLYKSILSLIFFYRRVYLHIYISC